MFFWYCPCESSLVGSPCRSPLALFPFSFCVVVFPLCHALGSNLGLWDFTYFVLHVWVFCLNVWLYHGCTVPTEARRGLPILWVWNYRWLWTAMWIMRIKPRSLQEQPVPLISSPDFRSLNMVGVHYTATASSDLVIVNVWCGQSFFLLWISLALGWPLQSSGIHFLTLSLLLHFVLPVWCHFLRPNLIRLPSYMFPNTCSSTCSNTSFVF